MCTEVTHVFSREALADGPYLLTLHPIPPHLRRIESERAVSVLSVVAGDDTQAVAAAHGWLGENLARHDRVGRLTHPSGRVVANLYRVPMRTVIDGITPAHTHRYLFAESGCAAQKELSDDMEKHSEVWYGVPLLGPDGPVPVGGT